MPDVSLFRTETLCEYIISISYCLWLNVTTYWMTLRRAMKKSDTELYMANKIVSRHTFTCHTIARLRQEQDCKKSKKNRYAHE